jgi:hypothetical protein
MKLTQFEMIQVYKVIFLLKHALNLYLSQMLILVFTYGTESQRNM